MNEKELQRMSQQAARVGMNVGTTAEAFRQVAEMSMPTGELVNNLPDVDKENDELISRREAIDALGAEPEVWINDDDYAMGANNQWHYDVNALKAVPSAQPEHIADDERKIADLHKMVNYLLSQLEQRWIPCSERFPEEGEEVLVYLFDGKSPYLAWIKDGLWCTEDFEIDVDDEPVAWMPLPEPYKEDGE